VQVRVGVGPENHLRDAVTVAQVDEDDAAEVVTPVHPPHQHDALAFVGNAQLAARVRAAKFTEKIQFQAILHVRTQSPIP
jgi:hypothetical protein